MTEVAALAGAGDGKVQGVERVFLIADVRGYTRFTRERGDAEAARLATRFAQLACDAVEARSGRVIELRGDEALAVFESAAQAVRAAAELAAVCADEAASDGGLPLLVGIGIDTGEAVPVEGGYRGAALNTAARLCSQAAAGQVLVTAGLAERAGGVPGIRFVPAGRVELKGFEAPVELIEVVDEAPASPAVDAGAAETSTLPLGLEPDSPLVGREHQLAWLRGTWRQVRRGRGRVVVVSGPAGIGKSRLAAEIAAFAGGEGAAVRYAGAGGTAAAAATTGLRATLAKKRASLLVLDDFEATAATLALLLAEALPQIESTPTLVLCLPRDPEGGIELEQLLAVVDARGDGHRRLGPLDGEAIRSLAGIYAGDDVDSVPLESIARASGGVPARMHELMSEWAQQEASRRLAAAAEFLAAERRTRSADLAFANNAIGLKLGRLYSEEAKIELEHGQAPYKGLASFEESDAALFFGREQLVGELAARTVGAGLLAVVGASGSGKSSVIAAGLLPSLGAGLLPGSERWKTVSMRPGERPLAELATVDAGTVDERLVLVVDQFEEVFTLCHDEDERTGFVDRLVGLASDPERFAIVIGLRGDYYGHCGVYPDLARLVATNQVLVGPMTVEELRRAIELPARRTGVRVESALTDALAAEIGDEPGGLPLLSTALVELWHERDEDWLRLSTYERLGGVRGAVARLAESSYDNLTDEQREATRRLFLRLVASGDEGALARRRVSLSELDLDRDQALGVVVERLTADRLLTAQASSVEVAHEALLREWPRFQDWLAEDAQGRELREHLTQSAKRWESADRDAAELYRGARLTATMDWAAGRERELNELEREFLTEGRNHADLEADRQRRQNRRLKGLLAGAVVLLVAAIAGGIVALQQRSSAQHQATVALSRQLGAEAVSEPRIDLAMLLAREAVGLDPSLETRSDLLTTLLRVPSAIRTFHWNTNRNGAVAVSPDGRTVAIEDNNGSTVVENASTGRRIGTLKTDILGFGPDGSLLAGADVTTFSGTRGGVELRDPATLKVTRRIPFPPSLGGNNVVLSDVSFAGKTGLMAVVANRSQPTPQGPVTSSSRIVQYDYATGRQAGPTIEIPAEGGAAYTPDARRLVVFTPTATIVFDARTGRRVRTYRFGGGSEALSSDGHTVAFVGDDGSVRFLDLVSGKVALGVGSVDGATPAFGFTPDGQTLVTSSEDGRTLLWDVRSHTIRETLSGHAGPIHAQSIAGNGSTLYTGSFDTNVLRWDLTGRQGFVPSFVAADTDSSLQFWSLAVSRDGEEIAVGSSSGIVNVWNIATLTRIGRFRGVPEGGGVAAVAFAPNGRSLLVAGDTPQPKQAWLRIWRLGPHPETAALAPRRATDHLGSVEPGRQQNRRHRTPDESGPDARRRRGRMGRRNRTAPRNTGRPPQRRARLRRFRSRRKNGGSQRRQRLRRHSRPGRGDGVESDLPTRWQLDARCCVLSRRLDARQHRLERDHRPVGRENGEDARRADSRSQPGGDGLSRVEP